MARSRAGAWLFLGIAVLASVSVVSVAGAQDGGAADVTTPIDPEVQRTAIARALFEEGLELADRGQWARAADRFRRAAAVRVSPPIRYNLAHSLSRLGRVVEAVEMLHSVEGDPQAAPDVRASARALRQRLEGRLGRLVVEVPEMPADARLVLDEVDLPAEAAGVPLPVDPGAHHVRLMLADTELDGEEVRVPEGTLARVTLGAGGADEDEPFFGQLWFWAAVGLVVASGAVAALLIATADDS